MSGCPAGAPGTAGVVGSVLPLQDLVAEGKGMTGSLLSAGFWLWCGALKDSWESGEPA